MYNTYWVETPNKNIVVFDTDAVKSVVEMFIEHYDRMFEKSVISINVGYPTIKPWLVNNGYGDYKFIHYNLEHRWPIGYVKNQRWHVNFDTIIEQADMVMDFQIENYMYFKSIGQEDKFKFLPLRYTTWFEQFVNHDIKKDYELYFDGGIDTNIRLDVMSVICSIPCWDEVLPHIKFLMSNTYDPVVKNTEKQRCKFCLDAPHCDYSQTINCLRIIEGICLDCSTIVYDKYGESMDYFGDLVYTMHPDDFTTFKLKKFVMDTEPNHPASGFKALTYNDASFKEYQKRILHEFTSKYIASIPDSILEIV